MKLGYRVGANLVRDAELCVTVGAKKSEAVRSKFLMSAGLHGKSSFYIPICTTFGNTCRKYCENENIREVVRG